MIPYFLVMKQTYARAIGLLFVRFRRGFEIEVTRFLLTLASTLVLP
jgi:hypothetical protein